MGNDAVGRYETYLHAIGNEDITTACEIGRPAEDRQDSDDPCEHSMETRFHMYSIEEKKAMQGAKVDRSRITETSTWNCAAGSGTASGERDEPKKAVPEPRTAFPWFQLSVNAVSSTQKDVCSDESSVPVKVTVTVCPANAETSTVRSW